MKRDHMIALSTTAAKMTPRQLIYTLNRKVRSTVYSYVPISLDDFYCNDNDVGDMNFDLIAESMVPIKASLTEQDREYHRQQVNSLQQGKVTFLNRTIEIDDEFPFSVDPLAGEDQGFPRLWTLKLLAFEPASWIAVTSATNEAPIAQLVLRWLETWLTHDVTSIGSQDCLRRYWTPYAVSRRIGNLAMLGAVLSDHSETNHEMLCEHLAKNVRFLSDHVEYDIDGNHLLENACALIVGGVLLDDDVIVSRGVEILRSGLDNQILGDGMHFERSPMYHTILLYRIGWCLDVLRRSDRELPSNLTSHVHSMYWFLKRSGPDNVNYPLLNDSVYHEAPPRQSCLSLIETLFEVDNAPSRNDSNGKSGYYTIESGEVMSIVDAGVPCPKHLPAHAHNDLGNVILWVSGEPVITDTGSYDYQPGERRNYARSIESHNSVQIDDCDQTVTHGRFMMGPRPEPRVRYLDSESKQGIVLRYSSPRFVPSYTHERLVEPITDGIRIDDRVSGAETSITSRLHLSPKIEPRLNRDTIEATLPDKTSVEISVNGADSIDIIETERYPEYGVVTNRPTIEITVLTGNSIDRITHEITY